MKLFVYKRNERSTL